MIGIIPSGPIYLCCGVTDLRKGMNGLSLMVQQVIDRDPHAGGVFCFRGRNGHIVKILSHDGQGMALYTKRLEQGRFVWPWTADGTVRMTQAQLSMLLEGIDWRKPERTWRPSLAG